MDERWHGGHRAMQPKAMVAVWQKGSSNTQIQMESSAGIGSCAAHRCTMTGRWKLPSSAWYSRLKRMGSCRGGNGAH